MARSQAYGPSMDSSSFWSRAARMVRANLGNLLRLSARLCPSPRVRQSHYINAMPGVGFGSGVVKDLILVKSFAASCAGRAQGSFPGSSTLRCFWPHVGALARRFFMFREVELKKGTFSMRHLAPLNWLSCILRQSVSLFRSCAERAISRKRAWGRRCASRTPEMTN